MRRNRPARCGAASLVMRAGLVWLVAAACAAVGAPLVAEETHRIDLRRCIASKCRWGRFETITITPQQFIIRIDPNWCRGQGYRCNNSYRAFTTSEGEPVRVSGYEPGKKSNEMFTVYVPRGAEALYVHGINDSDRDAVLELRPFEKYVAPEGSPLPPLPRPATGEAPGAPPQPAGTERRAPPLPQPSPAPTGRPEAPASPPPAAASATTASTVYGDIDELFRAFSRAYATLDAEVVSALYTAEALYLPPDGDVVRGRDRIGERFRGMFDGARQSGDTLDIAFTSIERQVNGDVAFEVGYYRLTRTDAGGSRSSRGKYAVVLIRDSIGGWRLHVDSYSPAPAE